MNPGAEAFLARGLGSRPSLGYPGDEYEMGLEAIEVMTAELAAERFGARHVEYRVGSGALANLYAFMATTRPGDTIIAPPPAIGGHVTHHPAGAAGLYGLEVHPAAVDALGFTVDLDQLRLDARRLRPGAGRGRSTGSGGTGHHRAAPPLHRGPLHSRPLIPGAAAAAAGALLAERGRPPRSAVRPRR